MSCKTSVIYEFEPRLENGLEPGKCYFSIIEEQGKDNNLERNQSYLLEVSTPKYKKVKVKYSQEELEKYELEENRFYIPIRKAHAKFLLREADLRNFTRAKSPEGYMFCLVEIPAIIKMYTKKELLNTGNLIEVHEVIEHSEILKKYRKREPEKLLSNQYFVRRGTWTKIKEANAGSGCGSYSMRSIEESLIIHGYDVEVNNIMEEKDKEALTDFQKKNGLKIGQLDFETLKKLGVIK